MREEVASIEEDVVEDDEREAGERENDDREEDGSEAAQNLSRPALFLFDVGMKGLLSCCTSSILRRCLKNAS
jgi:hypothetical protein